MTLRGIILTQQEWIAEFRNKKPVNYKAIKRCKESIECHQQLLKGYLLDWRVGKHIISSLRITLARLLHPTRKQLVSIKKGRKGWHISTVDNLPIRVDREEYERRLAELELQAQFEEQYLAHLYNSEPEEEVLAQEDWRNHIIA